MDGRTYGRGGGGLRYAGGCEACVRRHVPTSGGRRSAADGEGWKSHCAGPLRELFHVRLAGGCDSAAGSDAEQRLNQRMASHLWQRMASHHSVAPRAADEGVGAPGCH